MGKDRVPAGPSRDHYRALCATGLLCNEIADYTEIPTRTLRRLYETDSIPAEMERKLFTLTVEMAQEMADPTELDEAVFVRMKAGRPCELHWRYKRLHAREAIARGFGYAETQEYFRMSGTSMKKALNRELSNA